MTLRDDKPASEVLKDISTDQLRQVLKPIIDLALPGRKNYFQNWSGQFKAYPLAIFKPKDENQIKLTLELCRRESKKIRCFGAGHSPSDLACCNDYMMNLDRLTGLIDL